MVTEDNCSLAELDLLAECSEGEDEMSVLHDNYSDGKEEPIVKTTVSNNRKSARQRTLSSAAMERIW